MGIVVDIIADLARHVLWILFDLVMVATGEVVLWAVTGGRRKPRWDLYTLERPASFVVFSQLSCWGRYRELADRDRGAAPVLLGCCLGW